MEKCVKHICCVDSINEGIVRLVTGADWDRVHFFPLALFPKGIKEGDRLNLTISIDSNATKKGRQDVEDLYRELEQ